MRRRRSIPTAALLLVGALATGLPAAQSGTIDGRWLLVEQRYERGGHNFAEGQGEAPLVLTFDRRQGTLVGQLHWNGHLAGWPAYPGPDGAAPIDEVERWISPDGQRASASYRVLPAAGDDTYLRIEERYELDGPDRLRGLKEIVIMGRLIPAGTGFARYTGEGEPAPEGGEPQPGEEATEEPAA